MDSAETWKEVGKLNERTLKLTEKAAGSCTNFTLTRHGQTECLGQCTCTVQYCTCTVVQ